MTTDNSRADALTDAENAWEEYLSREKYVLGMPGLMARPAFKAGFVKGRTMLAELVEQHEAAPADRIKWPYPITKESIATLISQHQRDGKHQLDAGLNASGSYLIHVAESMQWCLDALEAQPEPPALTEAELDAAARQYEGVPLDVARGLARAAIRASTPDHLRPGAQQAARKRIAAALHYPDCWDDEAYPTLETAILESLNSFTCSTCMDRVAEVAQPEQPVADERAAPENQTFAGFEAFDAGYRRCLARASSPNAAGAEEKRGTDAQILYERKLTCWAIDGAMAFGYQNTNPPPSANHWLAPFWHVGRKQAELETAIADVQPLLAQAADSDTERALSETIDERDRMEEDGTRLANAVGEFLGVDVGEWSSANNPILAAIEALEERGAAHAAITEDQWFDLASRHANADWNSIDNDGYLNSVKTLCDDFRALIAPASAPDDTHRFKNFHRQLCERFGYVHDEIDWRRDQVSLIEWIAKQVSAPVGMTDAARDVLFERCRQIEQEGWTPQHDDEHCSGDLELAAACYAISASERGRHNEFMWPWPSEWWKPTTKRRNLVKAGALIQAAIERIDRALLSSLGGDRAN